MVSLRQAATVHDKASELDALTNQARRAAAAAEAQSKIAADQVAEMRALNFTGSRQVAQTSRNAAASERNAGAAERQVAVLDGSRVANERALALAAKQLDSANVSNELAARARLIHTNVDIKKLNAGERTKIIFQFHNDGRTEAKNVAAWTSFVWRLSNATPRAPKCGEGNWDSTGPLITGGVTSTAKVALSQTDIDHYGRNGFYAYGAVCYQDVFGKSHRTDFCSVVEMDGNVNGCTNTADPT